MQKVETKWHTYRECVNDYSIGAAFTPKQTNRDKVANLIQKDTLNNILNSVEKCPHIVISPELERALPTKTLIKNAKALTEMEVADLPFPEFLLEWTPVTEGSFRFRMTYPDTREGANMSETIFVHFRHNPEKNELQVVPFQLTKVDNYTSASFLPVGFKVLLDTLTFTDDDENATIESKTIALDYFNESMLEDYYKKANTDFKKVMLDIAGPIWTYCFRMYFFAMACTSLVGVEKIEREYTALNKKRIKSGKLSLPTHYTWRIGHLTTRNGQTVRYSTPSGRKMPIHLRRAHTRNVPCGKGRKERVLHKIPACLVNYDPNVKTTIKATW